MQNKSWYHHFYLTYNSQLSKLFMRRIGIIYLHKYISDFHPKDYFWNINRRRYLILIMIYVPTFGNFHLKKVLNGFFPITWLVTLMKETWTYQTQSWTWWKYRVGNGAWGPLQCWSNCIIHHNLINNQISMFHKSSFYKIVNNVNTSDVYV